VGTPVAPAMAVACRLLGNGTSWTSVDVGIRNQLNGVTYAAGKYVAVGSSGLITTRPMAAPGNRFSSQHRWNSVGHDGRISSPRGLNGIIATSPDGIRLDQLHSGTTTATFNGVAAIPGRSVVGGNGVSSARPTAEPHGTTPTVTPYTPCDR